MTSKELSDEELYKYCNQMFMDFAQKQIEIGDGKRQINMPKFFAMVFELIGDLLSDMIPNDRDERCAIADALLEIFVHAADVCDECTAEKRGLHYTI